MIKHVTFGLVLFGGLMAASAAVGQDIWDRISDTPQTLGIQNGYSVYETGAFELKLVKDSQTMASLIPRSDQTFDYVPFEHLDKRGGDGLYQLGDINIRLRESGKDEWQDFSSAGHRQPVTPISAGQGVLAAADLAATFPEDMPLKVFRYWEEVAGDLVLRFKLVNSSSQTVEIGGLGLPMIFDNILHHKSLEEAHHQKVFYDPYIGMDAGYLQVNRLDGNGPVLLVVPHGKTPFEAYRPLLDDPTPKSVTFEGFHEWQVFTKGYAEEEWEGVSPWNAPQSKEILPGEALEVGLRFVLTESVKSIEEKLVAENRPVGVGIPGFVLPKDVKGKLFLRYPENITSMEVFPANSVSIEKVKAKDEDWTAYEITGNQWGRVRLTVTYEDGTVQTIQYKVVKPETAILADMGSFLTQEQWYEDDDDLFGRSPSVISYDYEEQEKVLQDSRAWIAGLSDEGGAGSWLAAMMKQLVAPNPEEIAKLERFVHETMWGGIQYAEGDRKFGVKKSVFYYEPDSMPAGTYRDDINYDTWAAWSKKDAGTTGRSYNYPHVTAAYWVMYRLARDYNGLVEAEQWDWYLDQAYETALAMVEQAPHYAQYGQMEGSVFVYLLKDLQGEGWSTKAAKLEAVMRNRADIWESLAFPFGSEMPWDSTGQEEVYMWSDYFGFDNKARVTLNAILAYMPTVPHWGYNGSARRYWDFLYGGKISRIERQLHHYGSALNAIPVLKAYRDHPDDLYLLRVGHAGMMGAMANITADGFGPAAFHSFPSTLDIDPLSGDYGSGFYGYVVNNGAYLYEDDRFGWLGFGGNVEEGASKVTLNLTTGAKNAVFVAPAEVWITSRAGKISRVEYDKKSKAITVKLTGDQFTPAAKVKIESAGYQLEKGQLTPNGEISLPFDEQSTQAFTLVHNE
ncbi:DUF5695 domain-containing protein [Echinicola vietnamensis]|uniref:Uncharacterized protein n=1 Tax=Echinicola vietnamensis (strain DSM 17526 / LMG 23754 / KMM 6221) TaxID=926556 RepID=L0G1U4_ECHVK|nr:DUF5695 domain-containing protein [Echinicola vietnamensis]AGA78961.1 hypothetical protein Echvi_2721 [Echinicola vietnamensis DSM 17526]